MPKFTPGLKIAEGFYRQVVSPLLTETHPELVYAAGLMGPGSEVLGLDTNASMDHRWGPRLQLFLEKDVSPTLVDEIDKMLTTRLPYEYRGFPTSFERPDDSGRYAPRMVKKSSGPVSHMVDIMSLADFSTSHLGIDATRDLSDEEWLAIPQHSLLTMVTGKVFHDDVGLNAFRERLEYYPRDHWLFLMGCTWWRFRRAEQIIGRIGMLEDELGASVLAGRIVNDLMRLAFFMEQKYEPYPKWFGTLFNKLDCAPKLGPHLNAVITARGWMDRDLALVAALETLAEMHNALGITRPVPAKVREIGGRGAHVIHAGEIARVLFAQVKSPRLSELFKDGLLGNIDLITDNVDMNLSVLGTGRIKRLFELD